MEAVAVIILLKMEEEMVVLPEHHLAQFYWLGMMGEHVMFFVSNVRDDVIMLTNALQPPITMLGILVSVLFSPDII